MVGQSKYPSKKDKRPHVVVCPLAWLKAKYSPRREQTLQQRHKATSNWLTTLTSGHHGHVPPDSVPRQRPGA